MGRSCGVAKLSGMWVRPIHRDGCSPECGDSNTWEESSGVTDVHGRAPKGLHNRFWVYDRANWTPKHRWLPYVGGDEWCRHTLVMAIPFGGYLVTALWTCRGCDSCEEFCQKPRRKRQGTRRGD